MADDETVDAATGGPAGEHVRPGESATIYDVARLAGVSHMTV